MEKLFTPEGASQVLDDEDGEESETGRAASVRDRKGIRVAMLIKRGIFLSYCH